MEAIVTRGLCKSYGTKQVLHDVNLRVPSGGLFGFLGPNGAGKTTTIRILMGLLRSSGGSAEILGRDVWRHGPAARAEIGYLPGDAHLYNNYTGKRVLAFFDAARGGRSGAEIERLAEVFDLELGKRVRDYSRGMKQKLGLIQALMHRPKLLVLDEPTTALDPLVREALYRELRAVAADGRTVLFSSHTLGEVEQLCDEVAIVRAGRLIEQEKISVLRGRAVRRVDVLFASGGQPTPPPPGFRPIRSEGRRLVGAWTGAVEPLLAWLAAGPVQDVTIAPPDLEDLFMAYYADSGEAAA